MTWRERLRPGSFRGVPFKSRAGELEGGRRVRLHEYPGRDDPYPEDLGRKARRYSIEVYVIGGDYMVRRDALLEALERKGPGRLVHHWLGELQVVVTGYSLSEATREGRMARFTLTVVEAGQNREPAERIDSRGAVNDAADIAVSAAKDDFVGTFGTAGLPQFVAESAAETARGLASEVQPLLDQVTGAEDLAGLSADLVSFDNSAGSLVTSPLDYADRSTALIEGVSAAAEPDAALAGLRRLARFGEGTQAVPETTAARLAQAENQEAQEAQAALARRVAVIAMVRTATRLEPDSRQDAQDLRDEVAAALEAEIEAAADLGDDEAFAALADLLAAVVSDLSERGAAVPPLMTVTTLTVQPALALAYDLYEDAARDEEIAARNAVRHPGFLPAGTLEVLAP